MYVLHIKLPPFDFPCGLEDLSKLLCNISLKYEQFRSMNKLKVFGFLSIDSWWIWTAVSFLLLCRIYGKSWLISSLHAKIFDNYNFDAIFAYYMCWWLFINGFQFRLVRLDWWAFSVVARDLIDRKFSFWIILYACYYSLSNHHRASPTYTW